jgi:hypothetical protein
MTPSTTRLSCHLLRGLGESGPWGPLKESNASDIMLNGEQQREHNCHYGSRSIQSKGFTPNLEDADQDESLHLLEMPDGSMRLTTNWLPVDPVVGFTIGSNPLYDYRRVTS